MHSPAYNHDYLWRPLSGFIASQNWPERRAFDLGCGNGTISGKIASLGFDVTGVDPWDVGISEAQRDFPNLNFQTGSAYDNLAAKYGRFPLVVSLEVIEHCYDPRAFANTFLDLIAPGGCGFLSTPYHGYLKNLALAVTGKMDHHFTALWEGGHIKFFSISSLDTLLRDAGAKEIEFQRVGRIPQLAKSMVATVRKRFGT
jgi:2-polyprenyl-6-hydroxyphenyl methylase/3-demethylubiquinone-9 3-methyltransferase